VAPVWHLRCADKRPSAGPQRPLRPRPPDPYQYNVALSQSKRVPRDPWSQKILGSPSVTCARGQTPFPNSRKRRQTPPVTEALRSLVSSEAAAAPRGPARRRQARVARAIAQGVRHHVTQRGNGGRQTFRRSGGRPG
jgi:hypothetical protein